jgi:hypothetical protein
MPLTASILTLFSSFSFREFDENLFKKVYELCYENELLDLPYAPDVGDYLICEVVMFLISYYKPMYIFPNFMLLANLIAGH